MPGTSLGQQPLVTHGQPAVPQPAQGQQHSSPDPVTHPALQPAINTAPILAPVVGSLGSTTSSYPGQPIVSNVISTTPVTNPAVTVQSHPHIPLGVTISQPQVGQGHSVPPPSPHYAPIPSLLPQINQSGLRFPPQVSSHGGILAPPLYHPHGSDPSSQGPQAGFFTGQQPSQSHQGLNLSASAGPLGPNAGPRHQQRAAQNQQNLAQQGHGQAQRGFQGAAQQQQGPPQHGYPGANFYANPIFQSQQNMVNYQLMRSFYSDPEAIHQMDNGIARLDGRITTAVSTQCYDHVDGSLKELARLRSMLDEARHGQNFTSAMVEEYVVCLLYTSPSPRD